MSRIIRKVISTLKAPAAIGPYNQAILVNETLYVSGQLGLDAETMKFAGDDVESQTEQCLKNIGYILEAAGSSFENVVKSTVLLTDMNDFSKVNEKYASYFKQPFPARACYAVVALPKGAKVEIELVAVVGDIQAVD